MNKKEFNYIEIAEKMGVSPGLTAAVIAVIMIVGFYFAGYGVGQHLAFLFK